MRGSEGSGVLIVLEFMGSDLGEASPPGDEERPSMWPLEEFRRNGLKRDSRLEEEGLCGVGDGEVSGDGESSEVSGMR